MIPVIITIATFSVLIIIHEAGHMIAARRAGITVEAFSLGMGKRLFGVRIGGTDYRVSLVPFGGYCALKGQDESSATGEADEMLSKSVFARFWVIFAGPLANYILAFALFSIMFTIGMPMRTNRIGQVLAGYPAEASGILVGDKIISIEGDKTAYWDDIVRAVKKNASSGKELGVEVNRNGTVLLLKIEPKLSVVTNIFGQKISWPMLGVAPAEEALSVRYGPLEAVYNGAKTLFAFTAVTYKFLWLLVTGAAHAKDQISGPIGIFYMLKHAAGAGVVPFLFIASQISLALSIFNLFPILPLDGGYIFFLLLEKLRGGRRVSSRVQEIVTNIAVGLIIVFFVFVSWNDVMRFRALGKPVTTGQIKGTD